MPSITIFNPAQRGPQGSNPQPEWVTSPQFEMPDPPFHPITVQTNISAQNAADPTLELVIAIQKLDPGHPADDDGDGWWDYTRMPWKGGIDAKTGLPRTDPEWTPSDPYPPGSYRMRILLPRRMSVGTTVLYPDPA